MHTIDSDMSGPEHLIGGWYLYTKRRDIITWASVGRFILVHCMDRGCHSFSLIELDAERCTVQSAPQSHDIMHRIS